MNFNELMAKMRELDAPAPTIEQAVDTTEGGCGSMPIPGQDMSEPDTPPPSMSINLNAQGLDNIEELMKLIKAVNPDLDKPADLPGLKPMPSMAALPPLKMLPDMDSEPMPSIMNKPDDSDDGVSRDQGDLDNDGDHDMDDHDLEKKKDKEENFGNSLSDSEPALKGIDSVIMKGNDLHKKKSMFKAAAGGDNAMRAENADLRAQIRAELLQRLAEAKGAK